MPSWPPLPVQIIAGAISGSRLALVSRSSLLLLAVLPGQSSAPLYLNNKSRGSPGHTLRARHYCLLNNGPARCLLCLGEEHASQLEHLQIIFQESPDSAGGLPESLSSSPFGSPQTFLQSRSVCAKRSCWSLLPRGLEVRDVSCTSWVLA